jgi:hypothetical protein
MNRIALIGVFLLLSTNVFSQKQQALDYILEVDNAHRNNGWYIGTGPDLMIPRPSQYAQLDSISSSVAYNSTYNAKTKVGWNVEVGRYHIMETGVFHILEYGLNYRTFSAQEEYSGVLASATDPQEPELVSGIGNLNQSFVGANFGVNRLTSINRYFYLQNNLNLNVNYALNNDVNFNGDIVPSQLKDSSSNLQGDVSYKLGLGFRMRKGLLVLSGSVPVYGSYNTKEFFSRQELIHSEYHPLVINLRYMWLRKKSDLECPDNKKSNKRKKNKLFDNKVWKNK